MPPISRIFEILEKSFSLLVLIAGQLILFGMLIGILIGLPIWILYELISPAFGPSPQDAYYSLASTAAQIILPILAIFGVIYLVSALAARFEVVAKALKILAYGMIAIFLAGGLVQCMSGHSPECKDSRYVMC